MNAGTAQQPIAPALLSHPLRWLCLGTLTLMLVAGCTTAPPEPDAGPSLCPDGCPAGQTCVAGVCTGAQPCSEAMPCPDGQSCVDNLCQRTGGFECSVDEDCGADRRCVDGECFNNECSDGTLQPCFTDCGEGVQRCMGGVFGACSAQPRLEVCGNSVDDDCDGNTDEACGGCADGDTRMCETECGTGQEVCRGGQYRGCDAPRPRPSEFCGNSVDDDCDGNIDEGCDGCADGETRPCQTECGEGVETCVGATFQGCSAPQPQDEVCDSQDNDCDAKVDEEIIRDCSNACGSGFEVCASGEWLDCTAPEQCPCTGDDGDVQVCGQCGVHTRTCVGAMWGDWGACDESDAVCEPGAAEEIRCGACGVDRRTCTAGCTWGDWQGCKAEGLCEPGAVETEACGNGCGSRSRTCTDACGWGEWSSCGGGEGMGDGCAPGEQEQRACGACGTQTRICSNECTWNEWSVCTDEGVCAPGDEDAQSCGSCSVRIRTCTDACTWGDFGECTGGGQCSPGDQDVQACGNCGSRTRGCSDECLWGEWTGCQGEGPCAPGDTDRSPCGESDVGACELGVQVRACDASCQWGDYDECRGAVLPAPSDICGDGIDQDCDGADDDRPDQYEGNDTCGTCTLLTPDGETDVDVTLSATLDTINDVDYFCFDTADDWNFGLREVIDVTLTDIPNGADYDIFLYRDLAACQANDPLASSTNSSNEDESLRFSEAYNFDDARRYVVKVSRFRGQSCYSAYSLSINGLN